MSGAPEEDERSDGELLNAAAEGDAPAFWMFCVRALPTLVRYLRARCKSLDLDDDLAEDAVHEAIVRTLEWMKKNPGKKISRGWLVRVAGNVLNDWARARWRRESQLRDVDQVADPFEDTGSPTDMGMLEAFEQLAGADREVLELVLLNDLTPQEAAAKLGISVWATYKRYERALERFRLRCK